MIYGTSEQKINKEGKPLYKIPVLISGTSERNDPITTVTVSGDKPVVSNGTKVTFTDLTANNWSIKGNDGQYRSGVTLSAKSLTILGTR